MQGDSTLPLDQWVYLGGKARECSTCLTRSSTPGQRGGVGQCGGGVVAVVVRGVVGGVKHSGGGGGVLREVRECGDGMREGRGGS